MLSHVSQQRETWGTPHGYDVGSSFANIELAGTERHRMRDKINVLYYPDFWLDYLTLMKAILLFDELHFMDRPSMMFGAGTATGQIGTIGAASPLRQYEASFRDEGVPFFVHPAPMGPVQGDWYEQIKADVNDFEFLERFQSGLRTSQTFRDLQIARGSYGSSAIRTALPNE